MEIDETIKGRRSIRRYQNKDVPDSLIPQTIEPITLIFLGYPDETPEPNL